MSDQKTESKERNLSYVIFDKTSLKDLAISLYAESQLIDCKEQEIVSLELKTFRTKSGYAHYMCKITHGPYLCIVCGEERDGAVHDFSCHSIKIKDKDEQTT